MKATDVDSGLTADFLRKILHYAPTTGHFTWRIPNVKWRAGRPGSRAGYLHKSSGYWAIKINGRAYRAHRLAWLYVNGEWPSRELDHKNCDKADNRMENLRLATRHQNLANAPAWGKNLKGTDQIKGGRWRAKICVKYKQIYLGVFDTEADAHAAYMRAARNLHGDFARSK